MFGRKMLMRELCHRILFVISVVGLSWLGMLATHECGHIAAAKLTGGNVVRVVLHPTTISRTDVLPNPSPMIVAWAGPFLGCMIPALLTLAVRGLRHRSGGTATKREAVPDGEIPNPDSPSHCQSITQFFAGFCCLANGAYLGVGVFDRVGDADEILKAGTPPWMLIVFGLIASVSGMAMWHRLGSPFAFLQSRSELDPWLVRGLVATLLLVIVVECVLSPI